MLENTKLYTTTLVLQISLQFRSMLFEAVDVVFIVDDVDDVDLVVSIVVVVDVVVDVVAMSIYFG